MRIDDLIERVHGLTGPDRFVDLDIAIATGLLPTEVANYGPHLRRIEARRVDPYTASLDAAVALVERVLPGWFWLKPTWNEMAVFRHGDGDTEDVEFAYCHPVEPIALVLALLQALKAKEARDGR